MPKVMPIYGTRPEAIKVAPIVKALQADERFECVVTVTGQHREMLDQVNELFGIVPDHDLNIIQPRQTLNGVFARTLDGLDAVLEQERPDAVVVQVRKGRSASFIGAFEDPVTSDDGGFVAASCQAVAAYAHDCEEAFLGAPEASFVTRVGSRTEAIGTMGTQMPIDDLVSSVRDQVTSLLQDES